MPTFRVDPVTLDQHGASISRIESFGVLAETVTGGRSRLDPRSATSAAVDALEQRLVEHLSQLSTLTDAVGNATRLAAGRYTTVEASIAAAAGHAVEDTSPE